MIRCCNCRYWSDKLAMAEGCGPIKAYCLSNDGPLKEQYTAGGNGCASWEDAPLGAVDSGSSADPQYGNPYCDD